MLYASVPWAWPAFKIFASFNLQPDIEMSIMKAEL